MAEYQENPAAASMLITLANRAQWKDRRHGPPHVTDLTGCLRKAWYRRNGQPFPPLTEQDHATLLAGQAHHAILQGASIDGMETEVHAQDDSIPVQGSIDLMIPWEGEIVPGEIKTTRASSKHDLDHWPHYVEQLASYMVLKQATTGLLFVLHTMGDWSGPKAAKFLAWTLRISQSESAAWVRELSRRSREVVQPSPPDIEEHATWECSYCPFHEAKGGPCEGGPGRFAGFFPLDKLEEWD